MKTTILTILFLAISSIGFAQNGTEILTETFDAASSIDGWESAADASERPDDVTLEWAEDVGVGSSGAMRFAGDNSDASAGRAYVLEKSFSEVDFGGETDVTVSVSIKSEGLTASNLSILTEINGSIQEISSASGEINESDFSTLTFTHSSIPSDANFVKFSFNIAAGAEDGAGGSILVDDIEVTPNEGSSGGGDGEELLTNGDFEDERAPWTDTAGEIRTEGENSFFFADVETAGQPFDVNLSQVVEIVEGENYTLEFDASTGEGNTRTMIAGIGLNEDPFTAATETIDLTDESQTFTLELTANFGSDNSRVLFDMGAESGIVVIDNVSLVQGGEGGSGGEISEPATAAPTPPERNPEDVISIFSDAYTDITVDTFSADFDDSDIEDVTIDGNPAKQIDFTNFIGIDFQSNRQDASEMTHFHMDFWTGNDTADKSFNLKFSEWGGTDGEVSAFEYSVTNASDPALESGQWVTIDVPLDSFTGDVTRSDIAQLLITSNLDVVYVDNIYLYREGDVTEETIEDFSLLSPADGTSLSLSGDGTDEAEITWEEAESTGEVEYTWHADLPESDFSDPLVSILSDNNGEDPSLTLTFEAIDQTLAGLDVEEGESIDLEWTVTAQSGSTVKFAEEIFDITISRDLNVSNELETSPNSYELNQNYPNPFNPSTNITYSIPESGDVTLEVFNIQGQRVATLVNGRQSAGSHMATFDASNLASGVYTYRLVSGNYVEVRKMLLIK